MIIEQGTSNRLYTFNEYELAQHEEEIRKPLEDEIKELKYKLVQVQELSILLSNAYLTDVWKTQEIKNIKQERQKVIAELEEWVEKQPKATYWLNYNESEKHLSAESLNQKLNEMKGATK